MVFNDTTTKDGLIQKCEIKLFGDNGYGQISGNTNRLYQFTERLNRGMDRFNYLAMSADGRWQWDDTNNTDYNIATRNIISGRQDYAFALEHLEIEKVLVKDSGGAWHVIKSIDQNDTDAVEYLENSNSGIPQKYDKRANSLFLYPIPNYNSTGGLKIYFKRGPSYFVYTDTTKVPGFASIFHEYPVIHACAYYALDRTLATKNDFFETMTMMEDSIKTYYGRRSKDERTRLTANVESNK